jgi:hypothetical protein
MKRTVTNLMIAAAMMVAAAGSAPAMTTSNDRPTLDKSIADVKATAMLEQPLDSSDIQKSDPPSRKHPDAPVLVAPCGYCRGSNSIIQQIQDYMPVYMTLGFLFL